MTKRGTGWLPSVHRVLIRRCIYASPAWRWCRRSQKLLDITVVSLASVGLVTMFPGRPCSSSSSTLMLRRDKAVLQHQQE